MANPDRDAPAAVMHRQSLPAAGKLARLRGRQGSVLSRMGSYYRPRLLMTGRPSKIRLLVRTRAVAAHVYLVELVSRSRMPASGHRPSLLPARTRRGPSMLRVRSEVAE